MTEKREPQDNIIKQKLRWTKIASVCIAVTTIVSCVKMGLIWAEEEEPFDIVEELHIVDTEQQKTYHVEVLRIEIPKIELPEEVAEELEIIEEDEEPYPWTDEEVAMLAQTMWAEAGCVESKAQQAAVAWCILNRLDDGGFGSTLKEVISASSQFAYNENTAVVNSMLELAEDVLERWWAEKQGEENVGRTLPADYLYFTGDGRVNNFRKYFEGGEYWDWSLPDPYQ